MEASPCLRFVGPIAASCGWDCCSDERSARLAHLSFDRIAPQGNAARTSTAAVERNRGTKFIEPRKEAGLCPRFQKCARTPILLVLHKFDISIAIDLSNLVPCQNQYSSVRIKASNASTYVAEKQRAFRPTIHKVQLASRYYCVSLSRDRVSGLAVAAVYNQGARH